MVKILIVGDSMIDVNHICNSTRIAPEANIPIFNVLSTKYILGGATNVANNLKALNCDVEIILVIGNDNMGEILQDLIIKRNIKHKTFIDNTRKTTIKNRIILDNKVVNRYDIEDTFDIDDILSGKIVEYIKTQTDIDGIIISDYGKGVISKNLCESIIEYSNTNNIYTFIDPKKEFSKFKNCFCLKPNFEEGKLIAGETSIEKILFKIKETIKCENIVLTVGENGMYINNESARIKNYSSNDVIDVTGAGDVVISVLSNEFIKTKDLNKAASVASFIAGKSVEHLGNYKLKTEDISEYYTQFCAENAQMTPMLSHIYSNEVSVLNEKMCKKNNPPKIVYDYEIDNIKKLSRLKNVVFTNGCFDILHSAHIKLLNFSKKQGDILIVGLNSDASIRRLKGKQRPINNIEERSSILSEFDFIDYIIIFEDDTPLNVLSNLKPETMVKGGDYKKDEIIGAEHANKILLFDYVENKSSSLTIKKIITTL